MTIPKKMFKRNNTKILVTYFANEQKIVVRKPNHSVDIDKNKCVVFTLLLFVLRKCENVVTEPFGFYGFLSLNFI